MSVLWMPKSMHVRGRAHACDTSTRHQLASNHVLLPILTFTAADWSCNRARTFLRTARFASWSRLCSSERYSPASCVSISISSSSKGDTPHSSGFRHCRLN